ncbi:hypothetical protein ACQKII_14070 [Lysinibacillus sp. NPDC048646]|uniref:hypothetical protein n=1 Tax=Lysinibacillus sp. NPDC048646 TaxID=3390574 RepID=UPI003D02CB3A
MGDDAVAASNELNALIHQALEVVNVERDYKAELEKLHLRIGGKGGLVKEMEGLNPKKFIGELKALNGLTDENLKKYLKLKKKVEKLVRKQYLETVPVEIRDVIKKKFSREG